MGKNGIHHITAIAGPAQRNLDFYTRVLGLRLVKKTVNFDDPGTYHFYYGDETGRPGTILTFFPWEHAEPGQIGVGETQETVLRVPAGALGYWTRRLIDEGAPNRAPETRFGETVLAFKDPDGMRLALVAVPGSEAEPAWTSGQVPAEHAIRGFHSASLVVAEAAPTGAILTDIFGFTAVRREGSLVRYKAGDTTIGGIIDLDEARGRRHGWRGAGTVHHVAFRAASEAVQTEMVGRLRQNHRIPATQQKNRDYFRSVYFREPNGILFEIATDGPGFAVDEPASYEPASSLGQGLKLPRFLEPKRAVISAALPDLA